MNAFDYEYKGIYITRLIIFLSLFFTISTIYAFFEHKSIVTVWVLGIMLLGFIVLCGKIGELWQGATGKK